MLVICEDCAKKYHIDESRIQGKRARFSCKACGHIIVVEKFDEAPPAPSPEADLSGLAAPPSRKDSSASAVTEEPGRKTAATEAVSAVAARERGKPFSFYLLMVLTAALLVGGGTFYFLYFKYIPELVRYQIELRGLALAISLKETIREPLKKQNYLEVNQAVRLTGKLPGVAYAAVTNEKGAVIAYSFNTLNGFDSRFAQSIQEKGFPVEVLAQNGIEKKNVKINVGGQPMYDRVLPLADVGGEVHVGIPAAETDKAVQEALLSPLLFVPAGLALFFAGLLIFVTDWLITRPARSLTNFANRISLGELDLAIAAEGAREMRDLGIAVERMRHSVRIAAERLTARQR